MAANAKANEAAGRGTPYFLQATNFSQGISIIIATNNGVAVRPSLVVFPGDELYVKVFNETMSEILDVD
jgi:hypothetical protein